jgi:hypothetical protein
MSRKLFTLAAGVSAVLCIALCVLWVRSCAGDLADELVLSTAWGREGDSR